MSVWRVLVDFGLPPPLVLTALLILPTPRYLLSTLGDTRAPSQRLRAAVSRQTVPTATPPATKTHMLSCSAFFTCVAA
eukprot:355979-Chlamydomonas_euryale.AAC.3